ncbi:TPA: GNAT family N-acetyltransferase [Morganella morganii]|nr:GNAT family N-acetyltransferase [Morganella morganii]
MSQINAFGQTVGDIVPDWTARPYPARISAEGRHCRIDPLSPSHADDLYRAFSLAPDGRYWTWLPDEPPADLNEYRARTEKNAQSSDPLFFTITDKHTGKAVGLFSLMRTDEKNGVTEVGHVHFSPLLSGTVMSTEAHWMLMKYVFDTLGYRRYEWKCDSLNAPSRNAALRLGFQYEGCFRQARVVKGRTRDTEWFSITDREWPVVNHALEQWLSDDNFTPEGKQIRSLASLRDAV